MPRRPAAPNVPLDEAIALAGSRARLFTGVRRSMNWRARGVPWNVVGPILQERLAAEGGRTIVAQSAAALTAHRQLEALALTTRMRGPRWRAVLAVLAALHRSGR
jgi:hypothetical protein